MKHNCVLVVVAFSAFSEYLCLVVRILFSAWWVERLLNSICNSSRSLYSSNVGDVEYFWSTSFILRLISLRQLLNCLFMWALYEIVWPLMYALRASRYVHSDILGLSFTLMKKVICCLTNALNWRWNKARGWGFMIYGIEFLLKSCLLGSGGSKPKLTKIAELLIFQVGILADPSWKSPIVIVFSWSESCRTNQCSLWRQRRSFQPRFSCDENRKLLQVHKQWLLHHGYSNSGTFIRTGCFFI